MILKPRLCYILFHSHQDENFSQTYKHPVIYLYLLFNILCLLYYWFQNEQLLDIARRAPLNIHYHKLKMSVPVLNENQILGLARI